MKTRLSFFVSLLLVMGSCQKTGLEIEEGPTPYILEIPSLFVEKLIPPFIPVDNSLTVEGVALGEKLFFDKQLSRDGILSCGSCHLPEHSFGDRRALSLGFRRQEGTRNAMPLFNLAWNFEDQFNWDGKARGLESQALEPVTNPLEMNNTWANVIQTLQRNPQYPPLFEASFGTSDIDSLLVTKALAQFQRTLVSGDSPFDAFLEGERSLSPEQANGFAVFMDEDKGDCFHCHGSENNPLWTDNTFHNNGLDSVFIDLGLGAISGDPADNGKFKTPSLRNLSRTAPYMHDGRFETLEQVVDHYSEGLKPSATVDPLMKKVNQGGVHLSTKEKADLIAFLRALTQEDFGRGLGPRN